MPNLKREKNMDQYTKYMSNVTVQGVGSPVPVQNPGVGAGQAGSSEDYCRSTTAEFQAVGDINATGNTGVAGSATDVLARRAHLLVSPHRHRATSLPDMDAPFSGGIETDVPVRNQMNSPRLQSNKRRRQEWSPESVEAPETLKAEVVKGILDRICAEIRTLEMAVRDSYNTKRDIKVASSNLLLQSQKLQSADLRLWINEIKGIVEMDKKKSACIEAQEAEIGRMKERLAREGTHGPGARTEADATASTSCKDCQLLQERRRKREQAIGDGSFTAFRNVEQDIWDENIIKNVNDIVGIVTESGMDSVVVLPCHENLTPTSPQVSEAIERLGGREGLLQQRKKPGEIAMMTQTFGFPNEKGDMTQVTREILCPIFPVHKTMEGREKMLFEMAKNIRNRLLGRNAVTLAIPELNGEMDDIWAKALCFVLADTPAEIVRYRQAETTNYGKERRNHSPKKTPRRNRNEAVIVRMQGKSFADAVKRMKEAVDPTVTGAEIKDIRQSREGDIILRVRNGAEKAIALERAIAQKLPDAETTVKVKKSIFHIKDLDEGTEEQEIREAIAQAADTSPGKVELRARRPAYGGKSNITAVVSDEAGRKLATMQKIRIGWVTCRMAERKNEEKCFRCWERGHLKADCQGPDRRQLCLKCGKDDHKVAKCTNNPSCLICGREGHQTGYWKC